MKRYEMTIGGRSVSGEAALDVIDPSVAEPFARVPRCTPQQLDDAVGAAHRAFAPWQARPIAERRDAIIAAAAKLESYADELADLLMREQGKPLANARGEVASSVRWLQADAAHEMTPEVVRRDDTWEVEVQRRPLGVVGAITAWNYPLLLAATKLGHALLAGNTVVLKPSPWTPATTLRAVELMQPALPPGVLNAVSGDDELGRLLTEHDGVRMISFTGSVQTGKKVMASAAGTLKRIVLELGGNDAGIVLDDAKPSEIANDLFWARFSNCGQFCVALKRLFVPDAMYDQLVDALVDVARPVRVGAGSEQGVQVGPVQNREQLTRIASAVDDARQKGAVVAFESPVPEGPGYYFPLTILRDVPEDAEVLRVEAFGPVLPVLRYGDIDDAVRRANASDYGLGGSVWGTDLERANAVAARLECGSKWVNSHPAMGPDVPFGGVKQSGLGLQGARAGLEACTDPHVVWRRRA